MRFVMLAAGNWKQAISCVLTTAPELFKNRTHKGSRLSLRYASVKTPFAEDGIPLRQLGK